MTNLQVVTRSAFISEKPGSDSCITSELLHGEVVELLEEHDEYVLIRALSDNYTGYVHSQNLTDEVIQPSDKIIALHSFVYPEPDYKQRPLTALSFLSSVTLTGETKDGFSEIEGENWVWSDHLAPINHNQKDMAKTAKMFFGIPYLWGGKTSRGLDCSALVQLCATHAGHKIARDSKYQIHNGIEIEKKDLRKNDLVFFEGHVGLMIDEENIINASARFMDTRVEPLSYTLDQYEGGILKIKRL